MTNPFYTVQHNTAGKLIHFLTPEGLSADEINSILLTAESFVNFGKRSIKKVPTLRGKTAINLFFEPSTRTRTTFEIAAKRLSADVINLEGTRMSTSKGESLIDTVDTLLAMNVDLLIIRDNASGAPMLVADHVGDRAAIINAGDGRHAHPTQAMLDIYTIKQMKGAFDTLSVCIVGDILHSRVARSLIHALSTLGTRDIRVVGPRTLLPEQIEKMGVSVYHNFDNGIEDADVVIMLRQQRERMEGQLIPSEREYFKHFGLTQQRLKLAKADCTVMHPGPMNRGLEIESAVADGPQSVILDQVTNSIAVRMAVMAKILGGES